MKEKKNNIINNFGLDSSLNSYSIPDCLPLMNSDVDNAARLYTDIFLTDEPTSCRHAPDPDLVYPYARYYIRCLIGKGFSFVVKDEITDELVGFIFCFDLTDDFWLKDEMMKVFISHFREAVLMIEDLEAINLNQKIIAPGSVLHIFQIGVHQNYRRKGVAIGMISKVLSKAKRAGYKQVIADCTSITSRGTFEQAGFQIAGFSSYETFNVSGNYFFKGLDGGISLMIRDINQD